MTSIKERSKQIANQLKFPNNNQQVLSVEDGNGTVATLRTEAVDDDSGDESDTYDIEGSIYNLPGLEHFILTSIASGDVIEDVSNNVVPQLSPEVIQLAEELSNSKFWRDSVTSSDKSELPYVSVSSDTTSDPQALKLEPQKSTSRRSLFSSIFRSKRKKRAQQAKSDATDIYDVDGPDSDQKKSSSAGNTDTDSYTGSTDPESTKQSKKPPLNQLFNRDWLNNIGDGIRKKASVMSELRKVFSHGGSKFLSPRSKKFTITPSEKEAGAGSVRGQHKGRGSRNGGGVGGPAEVKEPMVKSSTPGMAEKDKSTPDAEDDIYDIHTSENEEKEEDVYNDIDETNEEEEKERTVSAAEVNTESTGSNCEKKNHCGGDRSDSLYDNQDDEEAESGTAGAVGADFKPKKMGGDVERDTYHDCEDGSEQTMEEIMPVSDGTCGSSEISQETATASKHVQKKKSISNKLHDELHRRHMNIVTNLCSMTMEKKPVAGAAAAAVARDDMKRLPSEEYDAGLDLQDEVLLKTFKKNFAKARKIFKLSEPTKVICVMKATRTVVVAQGRHKRERYLECRRGEELELLRLDKDNDEALLRNSIGQCGLVPIKNLEKIH